MVDSALTLRRAREVRRQVALTRAQVRFTRARARVARETALIMRYLGTKAASPLTNLTRSAEPS
jgi:hypothetical protein